MILDTNLGQKPLWSQLYNIINERIAKNYYKVGETLPTEMQLMEEFNVSRITVRQAMDKLISENKISRFRGKGTIVLENKDKISTMFQSSFKTLQENENNFKRLLVWAKYVKAPKEVYKALNLSNDNEILCIKRYGQSNNKEILAMHISYIHPITKMTNKTDFTNSLYEEFKNSGYPIESVSEEITATIATEEEKKEFNIQDRTVALINRIRKGMNNNVNIEYSISKYLADGYTLFINSN